MNEPIVSVIVPMFNAGRYIENCLNSLLLQGFRRWEAVVVDDGSTDDGAALVRASAVRDERVRLVSQANGGLSAARNRGIEESRGGWLVFLDADDWMIRDGLATLAELGQRHAHGLACAATAWFDESGRDLGFSFAPGSVVVTHEQLRQANRFQVHAAIVRRSALGSLRFDESMPALEDWDLWLRLTADGARWSASDAPVGAYRLRPSSMSRDPGRMLRAAERLLGTSGGEMSTQSHDLVRVRKRVALEQLAEWVRADRERDAREALQNPSWLPMGHESDEGLIAEVLWWRVPFLECLPPTAWRSDVYAPMLAARAQRLLGVMSSWGLFPEWRVGDVIEALAARCVDPSSVAANIEKRCGTASTVALHGLGRNAGALLPMMLASGRRVLGNDDAFQPGDRVKVASGEIEVVDPEQWSAAQAHVICPSGPGRLAGVVAARAMAGSPIIKWNEATTDISGRERARLLRLWPRTALGARAEVAA